MNFLYIVQNTGIFRCAAANQVACDFYIPFLYSFFIKIKGIACRNQEHTGKECKKHPL